MDPKMIRDLILAACVTVVLGTASLQGGSDLARPTRDILSMAGVVLALASGPLILWARRRQPIIPIAAIYCVVMFVVLIFINFVIAWNRGQVEM
jgi:hypothetical protein